MTPRADLPADRYSADQLRLQVSEAYDPASFDLGTYDELIEAIAGPRAYQREAIETVLRLFCAGEYNSAEDLARKSYAGSPDLQRRYVSEQALVDQLPFPELLSCTVDLATGTGKSYVIYAVGRILLNEGLVDRVLVLCPSLTIEAGLKEKFNELTADSDLTDALPERPAGHPIPTIVDASSTVKEGEICVENVHAAYERTGSSLRDSFRGRGERTLVISDEVHHVYSPAPSDQALRQWGKFIADPELGFRYHVGLSGTCYRDNAYFPDVVYRYSIRDAINEGAVKEVFYLEEDDSSTDGERFQKLLAQHEKNRKRFGVKPLTIAVTKSIKAAGELGEQLVEFLADRPGVSREQAEELVLVVTSAKEHEANVRRLAGVDDEASPTEWIVSVSMLAEGWDVKNVFQIYPHEKRAFNSKLLVAQVLGRGLRVPAGVAHPAVYVFNHERWGKEIDDFVAEVLDEDTTIAQRPVEGREGVELFELHQLSYEEKPTGSEAKEQERPSQLKELDKLRPQLDAPEETTFRSATDASRSEVLTTQLVHKRYSIDAVVKEVRRRLLDADERTGESRSVDYPPARVRKLIEDGLSRVKAKGDEITQENRQLILSAFGSIQRKRVRPTARLAREAKEELGVLSTGGMNPAHERIAQLTRGVGLFYDERSAELGTDEDRAALERALTELPEPNNLREVENTYNFKSPTNVVLTTATPERQFVRLLMHAKSAPKIASWVKAPDRGFYEIGYSFQRGGRGRSQTGMFNPDFFILLEEGDEAVVVETKDDGDATDRNRGKVAAATEHFAGVNERLERQGSERRYSFHIVSPRDYDTFFEALRTAGLKEYRSALHATLVEGGGGDG